MSDFESYEAYGLRTGADVERKDTLTEKSAGMLWRVEGEMRGKRVN